MREAAIPLDQRLFESPFEFDFFQAVRLLHLTLDERTGVGRLAKPDEEPVRFKVRQSLEFPPSSIHSLSAETDPPRMTVAFFGLTGVQGVLPHHYTEHILARATTKDFAMAEFLDLFNHRIISLFYRAWEKHRLPVRFQLAFVKGELDEFTQYLFDWIGLGTAGLRGRMAVRDQALLRYAGLLGQRPSCASALRGILRDYFGVEVEIEEFAGAWYSLAEEDQSNLDEESLKNRLGEGALAGDAVWDQQARFRIRLGPLKLVEFLAFLPDGDAIGELQDLVRFYVGPVLRFDVQLVLKADEVPFSQLGDESRAGPRLGWCGWAKTEEFQNDAGDAVFG
ncbi:MAG TPA: type VI secretion system baseplate subunit TssG [Bryobacteraceae bacterium]|jgi:type VI secretion system protein ImpH